MMHPEPMGPFKRRSEPVNLADMGGLPEASFKQVQGLSADEMRTALKLLIIIDPQSAAMAIETAVKGLASIREQRVTEPNVD